VNSGRDGINDKTLAQALAPSLVTRSRLREVGVKAAVTLAVKHEDSDTKPRQPVWRTRAGTSAQTELGRSATNEPRERSIQSSRSSQSIGTTSITVTAAGAARQAHFQPGAPRGAQA
jgi:phage replication-related protein YjqB (UPF0714/DUF867 family)